MCWFFKYSFSCSLSSSTGVLLSLWVTGGTVLVHDSEMFCTSGTRVFWDNETVLPSGGLELDPSVLLSQCFSGKIEVFSSFITNFSGRGRSRVGNPIKYVVQYPQDSCLCRRLLIESVILDTQIIEKHKEKLLDMRQLSVTLFNNQYGGPVSSK